VIRGAGNSWRLLGLQQAGDHYADASSTLPTSGLTGSQCFYSCRSLAGGNGTAWSSSNVAYTYMRIDKAGQSGYLTAA
jgi:hypothetical protein